MSTNIHTFERIVPEGCEVRPDLLVAYEAAADRAIAAMAAIGKRETVAGVDRPERPQPHWDSSSCCRGELPHSLTIRAIPAIISDGGGQIVWPHRAWGPRWQNWVPLRGLANQGCVTAETVLALTRAMIQFANECETRDRADAAAVAAANAAAIAAANDAAAESSQELEALSLPLRIAEQQARLDTIQREISEATAELDRIRAESIAAADDEDDEDDDNDD